MHRWLRTRLGLADIGLSNASREELLIVVRNRLALEANMAPGERLKLRDPDGRSLHQIPAESNPDQLWEIATFIPEFIWHPGGPALDDWYGSDSSQSSRH